MGHVVESRRRNRLLAALAPEDHSLLAPHLTELSLKVGSLLQEAGERIERVYFPHQGMISLLAVMSEGQGIETATVGSEGVVGAMSGFGIRRGFARAVVQAPLVVSRISTAHFRIALQKSEGIRNLMASYIEVLLAQVQQTAACNALHAMESRLARWLLQTRDRIESDVLPLTQEFLSQMLGVQRTTVTLVARQLEQAGLCRSAAGACRSIVGCLAQAGAAHSLPKKLTSTGHESPHFNRASATAALRVAWPQDIPHFPLPFM